MTSPIPELLARVDSLTLAVESLVGSLDVVKRQRRHDRVVAVLLTVAIIGIGYEGWRINHTGVRLALTERQAQNACELRNQTSVREHQLWAGLLALPRTEGTPEPDPETLAAFQQLLDETFTITDC